MKHLRLNLMLSTLFILACGILNPLIAQEHLEHPSDNKSGQKAMTIEEFADAAETYILNQAEENGGYFMISDEKTGEDLKLKLVKIHRDRLSYLGDNTYFVCADFKAPNGNVYDIDIFMKGTSADNLEVAREPTVHKVNDEPRYNWYKDNGTWKRKEIGETGEKEEHHEHPEHPTD